jgi:hypothetical protein
MRISSTTNPPVRLQAGAPPSQSANDAASVTQRIVDATVDKTLAGTDRLSGGLSGLVTGAGAYISKLPSAAKDGAQSVVNLVQAETIGPNIKVIAGLASPVLAGLAIAGAGIGLVISAGAGFFTGVTAHDAEKPREFTIGKAVGEAWNGTRKAVDEMGDSAVKATQEVRAEKLGEGEDPWDIPLPPFGRTAKTMAATVAGLAIGGIGGVATVIATTAKGAWGGLKHIVTDFSPADALAGVGAILASPVTGILEGASKVLTTPVAAAAVAWKEKSLGKALRAAGDEAFTTDPSKFSAAAGAFVGGAIVAGPAAGVTAVATTAVTLGGGLKKAVTDKELNFPGKVLAAAGSVVAAPVAGVVHGVTTNIGTPFVSAAKAWDKSSLVKGMASGVKDTHKGTKTAANVAGAFVGGAAVGTVTSVATAATGTISEVFGGLADAATNDELNLTGKVLDGAGGIIGDVVTGLGQGVGTFVASPLKAAGEAIETGSAANGLSTAAGFGIKSIHAAARPEKAMVELVSAQ